MINQARELQSTQEILTCKEASGSEEDPLMGF
jgi:hypothetical protein